MMWHVPGSMYTGHTNRLVEMVDLYPTLVELAGLPTVPVCKGDPDPSGKYTSNLSVG